MIPFFQLAYNFFGYLFSMSRCVVLLLTKLIVISCPPIEYTKLEMCSNALTSTSLSFLKKWIEQSERAKETGVGLEPEPKRSISHKDSIFSFFQFLIYLLSGSRISRNWVLLGALLQCYLCFPCLYYTSSNYFVKFQK